MTTMLRRKTGINVSLNEIREEQPPRGRPSGLKFQMSSLDGLRFTAESKCSLVSSGPRLPPFAYRLTRDRQPSLAAAPRHPSSNLASSPHPTLLRYPITTLTAE